MGPWTRMWPMDRVTFLKSWLLVSLGFSMEFSKVLACPNVCRCDRNFVYCNERSLTSVPLGIPEGVTVLYLHNNQINNAGFPAELHNVQSVHTVYLYGNQLDEFPMNLPKNVRVLHRICLVPLDDFNNYRIGEDTICSEGTTKASLFINGSNTASSHEQTTSHNIGSPFLLAGLIGGAVVFVLVVLLSLFCWHMHKKGRYTSQKWKYNRGRRKDDYSEAGTKKDNSILLSHKGPPVRDSRGAAAPQ